MDSKQNAGCGGGVGFFVREGFNVKILSEHSVFKKGLYESIWIHISLPKKKSIIIGNAYRPNSYQKANEAQAIDIHLEIIGKISRDKTL